MRSVMVQLNLTGCCLRSDIRSVSWTEYVCDSRDHLLRNGLTSSHFKWPKLVVSAAAEDDVSVARGSKGFGSPKKAAQPSGKKDGFSKRNQQQKGVLLNNADRNAVRGDSSQLRNVIDIVDKKATPLRIDPNEAKKGKVDFVRVQTWGEDEESGKLENLRVKSFSPAVTSSSKTSGPFYEMLVNRLQLLESKGEISVAHVKPIPSFDRWVFGEERYVQFLVDQRAVFEALRDVIAAIKKERCASAHDLEGVLPLGGAAKAVSLFAEDLGLDRCKALNADITSFAESLNARGRSVESIPAITQTTSYTKYLRQLGSTCLGTSEKAQDACLKFLAHVFSIYVSHLTTGMRIGAKAMDNIGVLRQTNAVNFYRDYPLVRKVAGLPIYPNRFQDGKDPLKLFIQTINSAGACILNEEDHERVMEELPKAMQRTSLILAVLAVEEEGLVARE